LKSRNLIIFLFSVKVVEEEEITDILIDSNCNFVFRRFKEFPDKFFCMMKSLANSEQLMVILSHFNCLMWGWLNQVWEKKKGTEDQPLQICKYKIPLEWLSFENFGKYLWKFWIFCYCKYQRQAWFNKLEKLHI
jgi:hypothetical protein